MSRRDELLAKNANIRSTADISDAEVEAAIQNFRPRSGQGSFSQRQKLEDRVKELEAKLGSSEGNLIPLGEISPNPWQPRRVFDDAEIQKLATSINEIGLVQPILVRSVPIRDTPAESEDANEGVPSRYTKFQIIAGERRFRAHQMLGRETINALTLEVDDADMAAYALAENMDRADLSAYEIAVAIKNAEASFPNRKNLAEALGLNRTTLYKYLAFFKLPDFVITDLESHPSILGRDAAYALASVLDREGARAVEGLKASWQHVKEGDLDQGKLINAIETSLSSVERVRTERDIKKLFVGKAQAGSITRDVSSLTIKIRASALTAEKEAELREVVERLFSGVVARSV